MRTLIGLALGVTLCTGTEVSASEAEEKAAVNAAEGWLKLVDSGQVGASWDTASSTFKKAVDKPAWEKALHATRDPLGKLVSQAASKQLTHTLPGSPDGTYVVIQYETQFEKKKSAVETIIPMLDTDGRWHVSGYFIR
jgi:hypothetical protein